MKTRAKILLVDDEPEILKALKVRLESLGYETETAQTGFGALEKISFNKYDVVLLDLAMPLIDGTETFRRIKRLDQNLPVIFMTAYGETELGKKAKKLSAYDYINKPFAEDQIQECLERALVSQGLPPPPALLRDYLKRRYEFKNIIGKSESLQAVFTQIEKVKNNEVTVLLQGESGTGKELVARAIHFNGIRMEKPFISLNCAAIPETLLESELFGFEKGAFTDAKMRKLGKFEQAHGGTLFLDEIGEMSPSLQVKILRALEEKEFSRIGGKERIRVDTRIITATNKDLYQEVLAKNFREDLYYRINVFPIYLPPLRERKEDIPLLTEHFIQEFSQRDHKQIKHISPEAMEILTNYHWKGNIRELENILERAMILAEGDSIEVEFLPPYLKKKELSSSISLSNNSSGEDILPLEEIEKKALSQSLSLTGGNVSEAARKLQIGRTTFYRKASKYGII